MSEPDEESAARSILLARLNDQPRSRAELAASLAKKNISPDVATGLLDRFEEVGLIDDAAFAHAWVESRQRTKGLARRALDLELRRKGIAPDLIAEALESIDAETEHDAAGRLVRRKLPSVRGLEPSVQVRRLTSMLARKGYRPQVAFDVVRQELENLPQELEHF